MGFFSKVLEIHRGETTFLLKKKIGNRRLFTCWLSFFPSKEPPDLARCCPVSIQKLLPSSFWAWVEKVCRVSSHVRVGGRWSLAKCSSSLNGVFDLVGCCSLFNLSRCHVARAPLGAKWAGRLEEQQRKLGKQPKGRSQSVFFVLFPP